MNTEKQARTKWCPLTVITESNPGNHCIGSDCMLWRWEVALFDGPDSYVSEPGPRGFCGLAGKPVAS